MRDGRVGRVRVVREPMGVHHRGRGDALESVVGILQMLKPVPLLGRVDGRPAGSRAEGVQILVHVEVAERVRRPVHVADPHVPGEHGGGLVEGRRDAVGDLLLPVPGGVTGGV